jgi:hypothetical protein
MKRFIIIFAFLPLLSHGQSFRELLKQRDVGVGFTSYQFEGYAVEETIISSNGPSMTDTFPLAASNSFGINLFTGWNFPVISIGDNASIGINPNIGLGVGLSNGIGLFLEAPIYLTFKYGTDAVWSSSNSYDKKFGFALGFGMQGVAGYTEAPISTTGIGVSYIRPVIMSEISFASRSATVHKIRFQMTLGFTNPRDYSEDIGYPAEVAFSQFGLSYIRTMFGR